MADLSLTEAIAEATDALLDAEHNGIDCHPFESLDVTAEKVVRAALPHIREQLAQAIQARRAEIKAVEAASRLPLRSDTITALIRGLDLAADVVRGES